MFIIAAGGGPQVFPLPHGQGFPWAHSTRGKPRRGMMRRAVFSGEFLFSCLRNKLAKCSSVKINNFYKPQIRKERDWRNDFKCKNT